MSEPIKVTAGLIGGNTKMTLNLLRVMVARGQMSVRTGRDIIDDMKRTVDDPTFRRNMTKAQAGLIAYRSVRPKRKASGKPQRRF